jgi:DNA-binding MarR family transcriptional regulator
LQNLLFSWARERGKLQRLPFAQERLLESINDCPCMNRTDRARSLGWTAKKFQTAKDRLEQEGFVLSKDLSRGVGRPAALLVLTEKGFEYLAKQAVHPNPLHGDLEHHCAIVKLQASYEHDGYMVRMNHKVTPNLIVDLLCERGDERGAVEVVHSDNLKRDAEKINELATRLAWVHLVVTSQDLFDRYAAKLSALVAPAAAEKLLVSFLDQLLPARP